MTTFAPHTLTSDELDALATDLARRVAAGRLPEREARMTILEAVHRSQIIPTETLKWCRRNGIAPQPPSSWRRPATAGRPSPGPRSF